MKLDKIKFAMLVALMSDKGATFSMDELADIDALIDIDEANVPIDANDVSELMRLMTGGASKFPNASSKIDAIKLHSKLTGWGLKESKDEVEKYWSPVVADKTEAMVRKINDQMDNVLTDTKRPYVLKHFNKDQLYMIKEFIKSF